MKERGYEKNVALDKCTVLKLFLRRWEGRV